MRTWGWCACAARSSTYLWLTALQLVQPFLKRPYEWQTERLRDCQRLLCVRYSAFSFIHRLVHERAIIQQCA